MLILLLLFFSPVYGMQIPHGQTVYQNEMVSQKLGSYINKTAEEIGVDDDREGFRENNFAMNVYKEWRDAAKATSHAPLKDDNFSFFSYFWQLYRFICCPQHTNFEASEEGCLVIREKIDKFYLIKMNNKLKPKWALACKKKIERASVHDLVKNKIVGIYLWTDDDKDVVTSFKLDIEKNKKLPKISDHTHNTQKECWLYGDKLKRIIFDDDELLHLPVDQRVKDLCMIARENMILLTQEGNVYFKPLYNNVFSQQHFSDKIIDFAVDKKYPWQMVLVNDKRELLYITLAKNTVEYEVPVTDAKGNKNKQKYTFVKKPSKTNEKSYKKLLTLPSFEYKENRTKIFFCDNHIMYYQEDTQAKKAQLSVYQLQQQVARFNVQDILVKQAQGNSFCEEIKHDIFQKSVPLATRARESMTNLFSKMSLKK